jgi:hypothetical protein
VRHHTSSKIRRYTQFDRKKTRINQNGGGEL